MFPNLYKCVSLNKVMITLFIYLEEDHSLTPDEFSKYALTDVKQIDLLLHVF
jgi:hypothetical protein